MPGHQVSETRAPLIIVYANKHIQILDARDKEIGAANRDNVQRMLGSFAIFPFIERLGWVNLSYEPNRKKPLIRTI